MSYKLSSLKPVLDCFHDGAVLGASEISKLLSKDRSLIHKYLKVLVEQGKLQKVGKGAHTKYTLTKQERKPTTKWKSLGDEYGIILPYKQHILLDSIFLKFSASGKLLQGAFGLIEWCQERGLDPYKKAEAYIEIYNYLQKQRNECGLLNPTKSFKKHVEKMYLDEVYYADQEIRMEFGRGKLAELTFYGKQSQNYELIMKSISAVKSNLRCLIHQKKYDAIAIVPWSIKRENQFLKILKHEMGPFELPFINIIKYYSDKIPIPQKSLKTREQRLKNAKETIFVDDLRVSQYKNVLLIDDFVGSGSTLNETAGKLKSEGVSHVEGFSLVGNTNLTYDVIREI